MGVIHQYGHVDIEQRRDSFIVYVNTEGPVTIKAEFDNAHLDDLIEALVAFRAGGS